MKGLYGIVFWILAATSVVPAVDQERGRLDIPHFQVLTAAHPTQSPDTVELNVIVKVPYDAIQFLKNGNSFEAEYELGIFVQDAERNQIVERIRQDDVSTEEYRETISSRTFDLPIQTFHLVPAEYRCIVELTDKDTRKSGRQTFDLDLSRFMNDVVIGDLILVDPRVTTDDFPEGIPVIPSRIADKDSLFYVYYEARIQPGEYTLLTKTFSVKEELLSEEASVRNSTDSTLTEVMKQRQPIDSGNKFKLELELEQDGETSRSELVVEIRWLGLTAHVSDLDEAIEQIRYIASRGEIAKILRAKKKKKEDLFRDFWKERDPSPHTVENELMNEYYRRVRYSNEKFGTFRDGWKTAMGMIFVLFGPPDDIEVSHFSPPDGRSYQRWYYYHINRSFLFVDYNGFGDYELLEPYYSPYGSGRR